jgi:hypothetical protein
LFFLPSPKLMLVQVLNKCMPLSSQGSKEPAFLFMAYSNHPS